MLVPLSYNLRSLWVRRSATLLTVLGIAATVAVVAGVLALQAGFESLYAENGREDLVVMLRPGATNESDSAFSRSRAEVLIKSLPEIDQDAEGRPLASMECSLAIRRFKVDGGETNVPIRGIEPMTWKVRGDDVRISEGEAFRPGADELIVGSKLIGRIRDCAVGSVLVINTTPFQIVGVLDSDGPFSSEIWGDLDRMLEALERGTPNRVIAKYRDGVDVEALALRMEDHKEAPAKILTERAYLSAQTVALTAVLKVISAFLGVVMGLAAIFTATNTMLSSISSRTREIGILLATGFRPWPIFFSFLFEALVLGLIGGLIGCLLVLPLNGIQTGTTNFQTFTEVAFGFRVTPSVLITAVTLAMALGLIGGAVPAFLASRLQPTEALRRM